MKSWKRVLVILAVLGLLASACGSDDDDDGGSVAADDPSECDAVNNVNLQLQWFAQAQFAGYYAAVDEGIYQAHCLDVTILEGGVDIVRQQQLASGAAAAPAGELG